MQMYSFLPIYSLLVPRHRQKKRLTGYSKNAATAVIKKKVENTGFGNNKINGILIFIGNIIMTFGFLIA
jgi:hypothetical protein